MKYGLEFLLGVLIIAGLIALSSILIAGGNNDGASKIAIYSLDTPEEMTEKGIKEMMTKSEDVIVSRKGITLNRKSLRPDRTFETENFVRGIEQVGDRYYTAGTYGSSFENAGSKYFMRKSESPVGGDWVINSSSQFLHLSAGKGIYTYRKGEGLEKYSMKGKKQWNREISRPSGIEVEDGKIYIYTETGAWSRFRDTPRTVLVYRSSGEKLVNQTLPEIKEDQTLPPNRIKSIEPVEQGYLLGLEKGNVSKFSDSGELIWSIRRKMDYLEGARRFASSIETDAEGNIYVVANRKIFKLTPAGKQEWERFIPFSKKVMVGEEMITVVTKEAFGSHDLIGLLPNGTKLFREDAGNLTVFQQTENGLYASTYNKGGKIRKYRISEITGSTGTYFTPPNAAFPGTEYINMTVNADMNGGRADLKFIQYSSSKFNNITDTQIFTVDEDTETFDINGTWRGTRVKLDIFQVTGTSTIEEIKIAASYESKAETAYWSTED